MKIQGANIFSFINYMVKFNFYSNIVIKKTSLTLVNNLLQNGEYHTQFTDSLKSNYNFYKKTAHLMLVRFYHHILNKVFKLA